MKSKIVLSACSLILLLIAHVPASAKGDTVKITVTDLKSGTTIESTDPAVRRFGVWEGPGTFVNGIAQNEGFIIAWSKGIVAAPVATLPRYEVKFYEGCKMSESAACHSEEPSVAYVVTYTYDPAMKQGYVYLPGPREEYYDRNVWSIVRGVEGKWFMASEEWQSFVVPLIAPSHH